MMIPKELPTPPLPVLLLLEEQRKRGLGLNCVALESSFAATAEVR
jgi:hypothetical protein